LLQQKDRYLDFLANFKLVDVFDIVELGYRVSLIVITIVFVGYLRKTVTGFNYMN